MILDRSDRSFRQSRCGVSLVEVLVVLGVIGILLSLLLPAVQRIRERASYVHCQNKLRQLELACHNYDSAQGTRPPTYQKFRVGTRRPLVGWLVLILPYIEQDNLWRVSVSATQSQPLRHLVPPHAGLLTVINTYFCPTDGRLAQPITDDQGYTAAYGSYLGIDGGVQAVGPMPPSQWGVFSGDPFRGISQHSITDGTSSTVTIGERPAPGRLLAGAWYDPGIVETPWGYDSYGRGGTLAVKVTHNVGRCRPPFIFGPGRVENPCDSNHFWSLHPGGANFAFADGSVKFLRYSAADILSALATRAGGEVVPGDF